MLDLLTQCIQLRILSNEIEDQGIETAVGWKGVGQRKGYLPWDGVLCISTAQFQSMMGFALCSRGFYYISHRFYSSGLEMSQQSYTPGSPRRSCASPPHRAMSPQWKHHQICFFNEQSHYNQCEKFLFWRLGIYSNIILKNKSKKVQDTGSFLFSWIAHPL